MVPNCGRQKSTHAWSSQCAFQQSGKKKHQNKTDPIWHHCDDKMRTKSLTNRQDPQALPASEVWHHFLFSKKTALIWEKKKTLPWPNWWVRIITETSSKQKITSPAKQMFEDLVLVSNFKWCLYIHSNSQNARTGKGLSVLIKLESLWF